MIKLEKHYDRYVWTNTVTDKIRKEECLCLNCRILNCCDIAKKLFGICKEDGVSLTTTRCFYFVLFEVENMEEEEE